MGLNVELLKRLTETPGIASREAEIRRVVAAAMRPLVDEVRVDPLGNLIGVRRGKGARKVMIAAHVDEIGFLVRHVGEKGYLSLQPVGGFDPRTLFAQRVVVSCAKGGRLHGVLMPAAKPIHLLAGEQPQVPKLDEFFVDVGLDAEQAKARVSVGDMVTLDRTTEPIGRGDLVGKAMDDRVGVFVMLEALRALRSNEVDIYAVATVQEEVGLRGAITSAYEIAPDVGIALDGTLAMDIPGTAEANVITRLGKGAAIKLMDGSLICDPRLVAQFRKIAEEENIPYQLEILPRGGTDAGGIQRSRGGVPSITLSIPTRYVHTVNEMVSESDVEACINLLARYLERANTFDYSYSL